MLILQNLHSTKVRLKLIRLQLKLLKILYLHSTKVRLKPLKMKMEMQLVLIFTFH